MKIKLANYVKEVLQDFKPNLTLLNKIIFGAIGKKDAKINRIQMRNIYT